MQTDQGTLLVAINVLNRLKLPGKEEHKHRITPTASLKTEGLSKQNSPEVWSARTFSDYQEPKTRD